MAIEVSDWRAAWLDGLTVVRIACPGCGREVVRLDEEIDAEGRLVNQFDCPFGCGFKEFISLIRWKDEVG